jgi:hypothetical protein
MPGLCLIVEPADPRIKPDSAFKDINRFFTPGQLFLHLGISTLI